MRLRRIFELKVDNLEKLEQHIPDILANVEKLLYYRFRTVLLSDGIREDFIEKYGVYAYFFDFARITFDADKTEFFGYDLNRETLYGLSDENAKVEDFAGTVIRKLKKTDILKQSVHTPLPSHQSIFKT